VRYCTSGNNDVSRRLFTDGRKVSATTPKGESVETTARWQCSYLLVVTQKANGGKLIQTYTLDQGAGQMIISTQITGQRLDRPIELHFVYDAEAGRQAQRGGYRDPLKIKAWSSSFSLSLQFSTVKA
jgi:hypothetical protein